MDIKDYDRAFPHLDPWKTYSDLPERESITKPVSAIFVMHDPENWNNNIQIVLDVLTSKGGFSCLNLFSSYFYFRCARKGFYERTSCSNLFYQS